MLPFFVMAMTGVQAIQLPLDVKFLVWRFLVLFLHDNQCKLGSRVFRFQNGKQKQRTIGRHWAVANMSCLFYCPR
ncbi:hypothetical protein BJ166DRAFT_529346 [Pestalotiopsis sp. NC0098]|nr:hypothetical protein BJ166DRAFT_529346 [Pestalotiopsis sp. NC0098]